MSCRDILVHIDEATAPGRCEIAVDLAARCGGRVTGLYLRTDLVSDILGIEAVGDAPLESSLQRIRDHYQHEERNAATASAILQRIALASNVDCVCRTVCGDSPRDLIIEARHADLVVVGPWDPSRKGHAFVVDVVVGAGVPALIVPEKVAQPRVGERVLVAWNGSRESSSALRDALPIFTRDAILEVREAQQKHDRTDVAALRGYLDHHACQSNFKAVDDNGQSIPKWLISEALDARCDLIVMVVYGHTRQREFVLSEVSQQMLQTAPLPLLISY